MPFPYRLAAIDLDETLLGPDHRIGAPNARAVHDLVRAGVTCVIASGRMHEATTRYAEELGLEGPIISYSGARVRHTVTGEVWHHCPVPAELAAEVIDFSIETGRHLNYYLNDHLYAAERTPWAEIYLRQTGSPMEIVGDLSPFKGTAPTKMILIDSPEVTDRLLLEFRERFGDQLTLMKTNPEYLEFMHPDASKGSALAIVSERLGISREETIAFGDGHNDVPMLKWAGLSIAMGTGKPEAIAAAHRVAPPYNEDGLAMAIRDILEEAGFA